MLVLLILILITSFFENKMLKIYLLKYIRKLSEEFFGGSRRRIRIKIQ